MKFRIHIKAETEEQIKEELREVANILTGLRESTKKWKAYYGQTNRNSMKHWEEKADAWINKHKIYYQ